MRREREISTYCSAREEGRLTLAGVVDVFETAALHAAASQALADASVERLRVDLSEVERLDITAVQLLIALRRDAAASGREITVTGMSPRVTADLERVGITPRDLGERSPREPERSRGTSQCPERR